MEPNRYIFLTHWQAEGKAEEAYSVLTDVPGYLQWWPQVYLAVQPLAPAGMDGIGQSYRLLTGDKLPYCLRWEAQIVETRRPHGFTIEAIGDFVGRGIWSFREEGSHLKILFDWRLRAEKPLLKSLRFLLSRCSVGIIAGQWREERKVYAASSP